MSEQLDKIVAVLRAATVGEVSPEAMESTEREVKEYASRIVEPVEKLLAISDGKVNDTSKYMFSIACTLGLSVDEGFTMAISMFGLTEPLSNYTGLALHLMVGYLLDEGYITINRLPEVTDAAIHTAPPVDGDDDEEDGLEI